MKVSQANRIIINPHITEKTFELVETQKRICFIVEKTASKTAIKEAIKHFMKKTLSILIPQELLLGKKPL
jgi:large subunit ribosomal protein L23